MIEGYSGNRTINGSFGNLWMDGEIVREVTGLKADVELQMSDVGICGTLNNGQKVTGSKGTGTLTMNKVNSRMAMLLSDKLKKGETPYFTITSKLHDKDSNGAEIVVIKKVIFSSLTLADWSANQLGKVTSPFTFSDWEFQNLIEIEE